MPQTRDGRYSRYLPERLAARYEEAAKDSELLSLREEIAVTGALATDALANLDTGESGRLWKELQKTWTAYQRAQRGGNPAKEKEAEYDLEKLIEAGVEDAAAREEVVSLFESRRKLSESERKRLLDMQQMVTAERATVLVAALVATVKKHVRDGDVLAAISADVGQLMVADGGRSFGRS